MDDQQQQVDHENVRLSAELSRIYNRLLEVLIDAEAQTPYECLVSDVADIAEEIRENLSELSLRRPSGESVGE